MNLDSSAREDKFPRGHCIWLEQQRCHICTAMSKLLSDGHNIQTVWLKLHDFCIFTFIGKYAVSTEQVSDRLGIVPTKV